MDKTIYLALQNGQVFEGKAFGAEGEVAGEIVFTTAMTGYLETLTDPSYYGQMVIQTFPLIGNYGVITPDFECDKVNLKAYIVREWCQEPSNFRSEGALDAFLKAQNVVGIYDIDTRELTKIIREAGVMNAVITSDISDLQRLMDKAAAYVIESSVEHVSCKEPRVHTPEIVKHRVVLWDFGAKGNICGELLARSCEVTVVPAHSTADEIAAYKPDGIMLSNGPGDPSMNKTVIEELTKLCLHKIPTFGICLGHQLLALSQGATTSKLKYGHRGANQPVKNTDTGRVYVTSQNHGYAVDSSSLPESAVANYVNANDGTCEGVRYSHMPAFSVQYHPEACGGPLDTRFLFDSFITMMQEGK